MPQTTKIQLFMYGGFAACGNYFICYCHVWGEAQLQCNATQVLEQEADGNIMPMETRASLKENWT